MWVCARLMSNPTLRRTPFQAEDSERSELKCSTASPRGGWTRDEIKARAIYQPS
jgi:hypothetical protein